MKIPLKVVLAGIAFFALELITLLLVASFFDIVFLKGTNEEAALFGMRWAIWPATFALFPLIPFLRRKVFGPAFAVLAFGLLTVAATVASVLHERDGDVANAMYFQGFGFVVLVIAILFFVVLCLRTVRRARVRD